MEKRTRRLRRRSDGEPRGTVPIRLTDAERIECQKAAERSGLSLDEWIRTELNRAAKRQAKEA
jgi:predicted HicB family RNase H-like nuclease